MIDSQVWVYMMHSCKIVKKLAVGCEVIVKGAHVRAKWRDMSL